jgi:hypothetical protein
MKELEIGAKYASRCPSRGESGLEVEYEENSDMRRWYVEPT